MNSQGEFTRRQSSALTVFDSWIAGPSAIGSEKGTPSSMMSAPPRSMASIMGTVPAGVG